jgi:carboxymethylenebutenolidase
MVEFAIEEGEISAHLALPEAGASGPGLLVLHPWWGLNECMIGFADRLAGHGFAVLVPDLYHGATATTIEEATRLRDALDRTRALRIAIGAAAFLRRHRQTGPGAMGVVGFSLGAAFAMAAAESLPTEIAATVMFYGLSDGALTRTRSAFLGHFADRDSYEPAENARSVERRLRAQGLEATFHVYPGTGHWFFESGPADAFNPGAAQLAWERTLAFLKRHLASVDKSRA